MGKNQRREAIGVCVCVCEWMHMFVCMSGQAQGGQRGGGAGGSCSVWKRRKLGGSVWRGRIHLFCIYLKGRPSEHGWQMSGECRDDTRAVVLFITISALLCSALSSAPTTHPRWHTPHRKLGKWTQHSEQRMMLWTRQTQRGLCLVYHLNSFDWFVFKSAECVRKQKKHWIETKAKEERNFPYINEMWVKGNLCYG